VTSKASQIDIAPTVAPPQAGVTSFASSLEHVVAEIGRVELLVRAHLETTRHASGGGDELKGLVISDQEVAALLGREPGSPPFAATNWGAGIPDVICQAGAALAQRREESIRQGVRLRLFDLEQTFGLSGLDVEFLVVCLAVEVDPRFERLYAYLQDDVTKKYASVDLVLNLVCRSLEEKIAARERFAAGSPLIDRRLLRTVDDPSRGAEALLARALRVDERIVRHLLDSDASDPRIAGFARCIQPSKTLDEMVLPEEMKSKLRAVTGEKSSRWRRATLYLRGIYGCGRRTTAEALCHELNHSLVCVDLDALLGSHATGADAALGLAVREAMLQGAAVYVNGFEALLAEDKVTLRRSMLRELTLLPGLIFLAGESSWHPRDEVGEREFIAIAFNRPDFAERSQLWRKELGQDCSPELDCGELANKFRLTGGQIKDAVETAWQFARWRDPASPQIAMADLYESCRIHSSRKLSTLGRKIKPHHTWADIVLPEDRTRQLREICNCVKYRSVVFDQWGFDRKLSLGKGLNVLFAGPSGTGKTMAAEIMAGEVGLDVYKIDLSTIVSKYIGETEKNLARIFAEAETSNAILFFDEAEALFGKRSEVRDSHDRYANIEINYLLQKMEEHEGVVILATNFRKNMDDAFVRRIHFTVEFPLPSEADRRRIWERIWPEETPQSPDLDFEFMARRFEMPGGNIRNVAMAAAFLAASDGGVVNMSHLLHGTRREYQKMGKVVSQGEFR